MTDVLKEQIDGRLDVLMRKVYVPAFMQKLAANGVALRDADDVSAAIQMAGALRAVGSSQPTTSTVKQAAAALFTVLSGDTASRGLADAVLADADVRGALS